MDAKQALKKFAAALVAVAASGEKTEGLCAALLRSMREQAVKTVEEFDAAVKAAYELNGWNARMGRPGKEKRAKVPNTVRTYIWELRSALVAGVDIWACKSLYEMRMARAKARRKPAAVIAHEAANDPVLPELAGVRIAKTDELNGSLFHDLAVVFEAIPEDKREMLKRSLERLLKAYSRAADVAPTAKEKKVLTGNT